VRGGFGVGCHEGGWQAPTESRPLTLEPDQLSACFLEIIDFSPVVSAPK
jgi:hypothetical protein